MTGWIVAAALLATTAAFAALWWSERDRRQVAESMASMWRPAPAKTLATEPGPEERAEAMSAASASPDGLSIASMAREYQRKNPALSQKQAEAAAEKAFQAMGLRIE